MGAKDWLIEKTAMAMLNQSVLKPYGTLTRLKLDTATRSLEAELELKGESQPVRIHVPEYQLIEEDNGVWVVIKSIATSRDWLTSLARDFAVGRKFQLPESVRSFLPMLR
jgi:hypothetical protein